MDAETAALRIIQQHPFALPFKAPDKLPAKSNVATATVYCCGTHQDSLPHHYSPCSRGIQTKFSPDAPSANTRVKKCVDAATQHTRLSILFPFTLNYQNGMMPIFNVRAICEHKFSRFLQYFRLGNYGSQSR